MRNLLVFRNFTDNPTFFLEVARVKAGLSKAVLPQQVLPQLFKLQVKVDELVASFAKGYLGVKDLFNAVEMLEEKSEENFLESKLGSYCKSLNLDVCAKVYIIGRIFSKPTLAPEISIYVYDAKKGIDEMKSISSVERKILKGVVEFEKGRDKILRMEGKLLGYPKCCVESYIESKGTESSAERKVILECVRKGYFDELLENIRESKISYFPSLFTSTFFPCSMDCENAKNVGNGLLNWLNELGEEIEKPVSEAFKLRTMINCLYLLTTGFKSGIPSVVNLVKNNESRELLESISPVITNITEFTNNLIVKIFGERMRVERKQKD